MPTANIKQIARRARVSTATVSRVINNHPRVRPDTRERVLSVMTALDYHPNPVAQSLSRSRPRVIGVVTHPDPNMKAPYFVETLRGVNDVFGGEEYTVAINPPDAGGFLLLAPADGDPWLARTREHRLPAVLLNSASPHHSTVDLDNVAAAHEAVSHLIQLGHKRVASISGKLETANGRDRLDGYRKALAANGLPYDETLVERGEFDRAKGREAMKRLLALKRPPTAVFAANDLMAFGAMQAVRDAGLRVPQDVAVVGFDDIAASAAAAPPLTTVHQPLRQMAREAARLLLDELNGRRARPRRVLLQGKLMIRRSCGAYVTPLREPVK